MAESSFLIRNSGWWLSWTGRYRPS